MCEHCESEFTPQRVRQGGNRFCSRKCKERARNATPEFKAGMLDRYYQRRYGLTLEEVRAMKARGCEICGRTEVAGRWAENMHIDHCHETGEVRGVLCNGCNLGLGHFQHDPELLRRAIAYLDR